MEEWGRGQMFWRHWHWEPRQFLLGDQSCGDSHTRFVDVWGVHGSFIYLVAIVMLLYREVRESNLYWSCCRMNSDWPWCCQVGDSLLAGCRFYPVAFYSLLRVRIYLSRVLMIALSLQVVQSYQTSSLNLSSTHPAFNRSHQGSSPYLLLLCFIILFCILGAKPLPIIIILKLGPSRKDCLFPVTRPTHFWLPEAKFFFYFMNLIKS